MVSNVNHLSAYKSTHQKNTKDLLSKAFSERKGEMLDMISTGNGQTRLVFLVPARGLIGYSTEFLSMTRGYGIMNHTFRPILAIDSRGNWWSSRGALVSIDAGKATTYSIMSIEERGTIFVNPGTEVYVRNDHR